MTVSTLVATPDPDPRDLHLHRADMAKPLPGDVEQAMAYTIRTRLFPAVARPTVEEWTRTAVAEYEHRLALLADLRSMGGELL
jgi:hypothetical protein